MVNKNTEKILRNRISKLEAENEGLKDCLLTRDYAIKEYKKEIAQLKDKIKKLKEVATMDMRCSICGKYGIYWKNLHTIHSYTYCPHCGGVECHEPQEEYFEDEEVVTASNN